MSRILVIPDVHLKPEMFDYADDVDAKEYDNICCLGDVADDWQTSSLNDYKDTYDRALAFAREHSTMLWCYGNHDISYLFSSFNITFLEPGFNYWAAYEAESFLRMLKLILGPQLEVVHRIDNTIFSHAGVSDSFVMREIGNKTEINEVISKINRMVTPEYISHLWEDDSPLWVRPQYDAEIQMYNDCFQVVGHTPVKEAMLCDNVLSLDTFSTNRRGKQIGNEKMYIVDTQSFEYEMVI